MVARNHKKGLSIVDVAYKKLLKPEMLRAISEGQPDRAASFARELAKLYRKENKAGQEDTS